MTHFFPNRSTKVPNPQCIDFLYCIYLRYICVSVCSTYSTLMHDLLECTSLGIGEPPSLDTLPCAAASRSRVCKNMYMLLLSTKKKAQKLSSYIATCSDESVNLQELSLKLHTLYLEKSPVLFILSIKNFSESVEGSGL